MDWCRQVSLCIAIKFCQTQQHVTFSQTKVNTKLISWKARRICWNSLFQPINQNYLNRVAKFLGFTSSRSFISLYLSARVFLALNDNSLSEACLPSFLSFSVFERSLFILLVRAKYSLSSSSNWSNRFSIRYDFLRFLTIKVCGWLVPPSGI